MTNPCCGGKRYGSYGDTIVLRIEIKRNSLFRVGLGGEISAARIGITRGCLAAENAMEQDPDWLGCRIVRRSLREEVWVVIHSQPGLCLPEI